MSVNIADTLGRLGKGFWLLFAKDAGLSDGRSVETAITEIEAIAKGRSKGYVFDTEADMNTQLADTTFVSKLLLGDNLYIRELNVPDYWWDGAAAQRLETQKIDTDEFVKIASGVENAGKYLVIDEDGNVTEMDIAVSQDTDNKLSLRDDGLYVAPTDLTGYAQIDDTEASETSVFSSSKVVELIGEGGGGSGLEAVSSGGKIIAEKLFYNYEDYSTEEKVVGKWDDGKPIYRKVIIDTTPTMKDGTYTTKTINYTMDIDEVIRLDSKIINTANCGYPLPYATNSGYNAKVNIRLSDKRFEFTGAVSNFSNSTLCIMVEYTKTTDAENSFDASMVSDGKRMIVSSPTYDKYSTSETLCGKWIDGKPIYRKVINDSLPTITTNGTPATKTIDISSLNIDVVSNLYGVLKNTDTGFYQPLNSVIAPSAGYYVRAYVDGQGLKLSSALASFSNHPAIVILEYTKSTDDANSFSYEMLYGESVADTASNSEVEEVFGC